MNKKGNKPGALEADSKPQPPKRDAMDILGQESVTRFDSSTIVKKKKKKKNKPVENKEGADQPVPVNAPIKKVKQKPQVIPNETVEEKPKNGEGDKKKRLPNNNRNNHPRRRPEGRGGNPGERNNSPKEHGSSASTNAENQ